MASNTGLIIGIVVFALAVVAGIVVITLWQTGVIWSSDASSTTTDTDDKGKKEEEDKVDTTGGTNGGTPGTNDGTPGTNDGTPGTNDGTPGTNGGTPETDVPTPAPDDSSCKATVQNTPYVAKTNKTNSDRFESGSSVLGPHGSKLTLKETGVLELTDKEGTVLWKSSGYTANVGDSYVFYVQGDANICVYNDKNKNYWCGKTYKAEDTTPYTLRFNSDNKCAVWLELVDKNKTIIWTTKKP